MELILEVFQSPQLREKNEKIQIFTFGYLCLAKSMEGWLKICNLFLVYRHILLNLPRDNHHFDDKQKFLKKTLIRIPSVLKFGSCKAISHVKKLIGQDGWLSKHDKLHVQSDVSKSPSQGI